MNDAEAVAEIDRRILERAKESGPMVHQNDVLDALRALTVMKACPEEPVVIGMLIPALEGVCYEVLERRRAETEEATTYAKARAAEAEDRLSMVDLPDTKNADPIEPDGKKGLRDQLTDLMNHRSREGLSQTPDYLLAEYLIQCLVAYETTVRQRDHFHGVKL